MLNRGGRFEAHAASYPPGSLEEIAFNDGFVAECEQDNDRKLANARVHHKLSKFAIFLIVAGMIGLMFAAIWADHLSEQLKAAYLQGQQPASVAYIHQAMRRATSQDERDLFQECVMSSQPTGKPYTRNAVDNCARVAFPNPKDVATQNAQVAAMAR